MAAVIMTTISDNDGGGGGGGDNGDEGIRGISHSCLHAVCH